MGLVKLSRNERWPWPQRLANQLLLPSFLPSCCRRCCRKSRLFTPLNDGVGWLVVCWIHWRCCLFACLCACLLACLCVCLFGWLGASCLLLLSIGVRCMFLFHRHADNCDWGLQISCRLLHNNLHLFFVCLCCGCGCFISSVGDLSLSLSLSLSLALALHRGSSCHALSSTDCRTDTAQRSSRLLRSSSPCQRRKRSKAATRSARTPMWLSSAHPREAAAEMPTNCRPSSI